jgi:TRAP transporter 4TM/12TM fusion protein
MKNIENPEDINVDDRLRGWSLKLFSGGCIAWVLFQVWYASPLPFIFDIGLLNNTQSRSIHLAFAIFLAFLSFGFRKQNKSLFAFYEWIPVLLGVWGALYIFLYYEDLADRSGAPITLDLLSAFIGIVLLLEAARRSLGLPLVIVATCFIAYSIAGPYMPEIIAHKGASLSKLLSHQWLTTEGVFGVALGVSTDFVFLFVLFGAMLERAGAGTYFIKVAFALMGHMRGGPAKAAVVASGLSGVISGSSISNVVTTGTFTIPLMKKVGFPSHKAGAIEVAASTNGQLTPPIMGAAAFLMVEYVGIPYVDVVKHAILPALISYLALFYIVHLEAVKAGMKGLPKRQSTVLQKLSGYALLIFGLCALSLIIYYGLGWIKMLFPQAAVWIVSAVLLAAYVFLVQYASKFYLIAEKNDLSKDITQLPEVGPIAKSGLYFLLPIIILIWCLTVEKFSPGLSAFYALLSMIVIMLTQRPLLAYFMKTASTKKAFNVGLVDLLEASKNGAKNMVGIGIATATAGIVVGTITLTGIGQVMTDFVLQVSSGNILLTLIFTAVICLILGMGLPTTANYIVVATLMSPVIVNIGAISGFIVPLVAVHLFVFYFGILADDTPPVGLAAFAAAGIADSDPIKTGIQGFIYDIRTAILPFMFIFNTQLLLIDIDGIANLIIVIITAIAAILIFAAATQGYWLTKTKKWEMIALLLVAFTFFRPDFWMNQLIEPYNKHQATKIYELIDKNDSNDLRLIVEGESLDGSFIRKTVLLPLPDTGTAQERVQAVGLSLIPKTDTVVVDLVEAGSVASKAGIDFDWEIIAVEQTAKRPPSELFYIPAIALLGLVWWRQRKRIKVN